MGLTLCCLAACLGPVCPIRYYRTLLFLLCPRRKVWVSWIDAADAKPGTINSGFRYGQEIAIVCDPKGGLFALSNKMPPTGQPTTFAKFGEKGTVVEPITLTEFSTKTGKQVGTWCPSPVGRLLIGRLTSPSDIPVCELRATSKLPTFIHPLPFLLPSEICVDAAVRSPCAQARRLCPGAD